MKTKSKIVGTCSECNGPVRIVGGVKTCGNCGTTERKDYGPVIPMEPDIPPRHPRIPPDEEPWHTRRKERQVPWMTFV